VIQNVDVRSLPLRGPQLPQAGRASHHPERRADAPLRGAGRDDRRRVVPARPAQSGYLTGEIIAIDGDFRGAGMLPIED